MRLNVDSELGELSDKIALLYSRLDGDLKPLMQGIGAIVESSTRDRFRTKTAPDGSSWDDLKPSTVAAKNGRGGILVDRGDFMRSITHHATSVSVQVGSDRPYSKYHQTGTKNSDGSERMAARPVFGLSDDDYADIRDLLNDFMEDLI